MSAGHLKITDEKVVFVHTKSGRKDTLKVYILRFFFLRGVIKKQDLSHFRFP